MTSPFVTLVKQFGIDRVKKSERAQVFYSMMNFRLELLKGPLTKLIEKNNVESNERLGQTSAAEMESFKRTTTEVHLGSAKSGKRVKPSKLSRSVKPLSRNVRKHSSTNDPS